MLAAHRLASNRSAPTWLAELGLRTLHPPRRNGGGPTRVP